MKCPNDLMTLCVGHCQPIYTSFFDVVAVCFARLFVFIQHLLSLNGIKIIIDYYDSY